MKLQAFLALPALAGALVAASASAATSPLIVDRQRVDREPPAAPTPAPRRQPRTPQGPAQTPAALPAGVTIHSVQVVGSTATPAQIGPASRPFIGKPLDKPTLQAIAQAVAAAYARTDIALYTVDVPQQDFAGGVVQVRVTEGYVEHVFLTGPAANGNQRLVTRYAARVTVEHPLRRSTLERYLSLIRDIPGLKVDPKLVAGSQPGAVRLMLDLKRRPVQISLSVDDRGTAYLGRGQLTLEADFNSIVRQGDQTRLIVAAPTDFEQYHYYAVSHSEPISDNGLTATGQFGYLATRPRGSPVRGHVTLGSAQLSYPVIRSYNDKLNVGGEFDLLNSDNGAFGAVITSEHTRVARGSVSYGHTGERRSWQAAASVSQGVDGLGARVNPVLGRPNFTKGTLQGGFDQRMWKRFVLRLRATSQLASTALPVSEAFSLGGDQYGRAFPSAYVLGDSGAAGSAEFAWQPPAPTAFLDGSELYTFLDGGHADVRSRIGLPGVTYRLASAGGGVRFDLAQKAVFTVEAARAVQTPFPTDSRPWRLILGWRGAF